MATGPRRTVRAVLLDAGGVLLELDFAFLARLIEARGRQVAREALRRAERRARDEIEQRLAAGGRPADTWRDYFHVILGAVGVPGDEHDRIVDALWEAHRRVGLWTVAPAGAVETVRRLRERGLRLAVVSNAEGQVARDLEAAGYRGLFDAVVDSHLVGVEKPDPRIFAIALERVGTAPEHAVHVGDVPSVDVVGAQAAGITPLLLDPHGRYRHVPVTHLRVLADLVGWLGEPGGSPGDPLPAHKAKA